MTAGYSSTPQSKKLGIKPGLRVGLHAAPEGWALTDPPPFEPAEEGAADVLIAFIRAIAELPPLLDGLGERIFPNGSLWIAWPRRAGGHQSDVTDNLVRELVLPTGMVDVKIAAMDEDWSAMKVVWRLENRGKNRRKR